MIAAVTLTVITNDQGTPPPRRKIKLSKVDYDPANPSRSKINVNFVRVTRTDGSDVPDPTALANIALAHTGTNFHLLSYKFVGTTRKTLIIWFYATQPGDLSPKVVTVANLVVTINSTDSGTDPNVETEP